ncbi:MAG: GNAT family N-acetyltransferase [Rhodobacteraceae bacterium]|nr:MAG: GNAT family N-acetyltransferase [Paracoccaceae bacterium]
MGFDIASLVAADLPAALSDLGEILHATVQGGASVGFIQPFTPEDATGFWQSKIFPAVRTGDTVLFVAYLGNRISGTVQLGLGLPPNQPHRADVAKLLVHPQARRSGLGRALMAALETEARVRGKQLLVLDTRSGDPSQQLYKNLGFQVAGEVPGFCRHPSEDFYESTTYMFKHLS